MTSKKEQDRQSEVQKQQIAVMDAATAAVLVCEEDRDRALASVESVEKGQLDALKAALADFPGVVTEAVWDATLRRAVAERLGQSRSKSTLLNRLKRATMGLTLGREDGSFLPEQQTSLKKYADWVGVKLQASDDPVTGEPRLKSIAKSTAKKTPKLAQGQTYWLIGSNEGSDYQAIIGDSADFRAVQALAKLHRQEFQGFWFIVAQKPQQVELPADEEMREFRLNTSVFSTLASAGSRELAI